MLQKRFSKSSINTSRNKRVNRYRLVRFSRIILPLLIISIIFSVYQRLFIIRNVICQVENGSCPLSVSNLLSSYLGKSILFFDYNHLQLNINDSAKPESIAITPKIPGVLSVKLTFSSYKIPVTIVDIAYQSDTEINKDYLNQVDSFVVTHGTTKQLTKEGQLLDGTNETSNLVIVNPADYPEDKLAELANSLSILGQQGINYSQAYLLSNGFAVRLDQDRIIIFSLDRPYLDQITALQQILTAATIKDSQLIDLRFNRPVIK